VQKFGKKPLLTFVATHEDNYTWGSCFRIEGESADRVIPSAILRRNFPQAKTNTRLKIQFYPWEVDVGRTIWLKDCRPYFSDLNYTFSRRGKVINSEMPSSLQAFLGIKLGIKSGDKAKFKIVVTAI